MDKRVYTRWALRVLFYVVGLFILALGVAFSVNSKLGVSPVNCLPYVVSQSSGFAMSACVVIVFCMYIALQVVILRREFRAFSLLQIVFSFIFGYFVDFTAWILGDFALPTYFGQLAMLAISIVLIAIGVMLYIEVEIIPMPMEGLSLSVAKKTGMRFHNVKIIIDCLVVVVSIVLSFLFLHSLVGVREGTVITAVVTGKVIGWVKKPIGPYVRKLCFDDAPMPEREEDKVCNGETPFMVQ